MKTFEYFKKSMCLLLSLILLSANTQVFAQYEGPDLPNLIDPALHNTLKQKMKNINELADDIESSLQGLLADAMGDNKALTEVGKKNVLERVNKELNQVDRSYAELSSEVDDVTKRLNKNLQKMSSGNIRYNVSEVLAKRYYGTGSVIERDIYVVEKVSLPEVEKLRGAVNELLSSGKIDIKTLEKMSIWTEQLKMGIKFGLESRVNYVLGQNKSFFESMSHLAGLVDREKIWELAFSHYTPQQQASVNLILQASKKSKSPLNLAKDVNRYLAKFKGGVKPSLWNTLKLSKQLRQLSPEARIRYVDEITQLEPAEMHLAKSVAKKPGVASKFIKMGTPLMIVGAIITVVSITEVNAQNAFPEFASIREKREIQRAIENDEPISAVAALRWYTDAQNMSIIEKNNAHYMNLMGIVFSLAQAEEDKEGILSVLNEMDPDPTAVQGQGAIWNQTLKTYVDNTAVQNKVEKQVETVFDKYNKSKK